MCRSSILRRRNIIYYFRSVQVVDEDLYLSGVFSYEVHYNIPFVEWDYGLWDYTLLLFEWSSGTIRGLYLK